MLIDYQGEPGLSVYAILRTADAVFDPLTGALVSMTLPISNQTYAIALTESGYARGSYSVSIGLGTNGTYTVEYWQRAGSTPDRSADARLGSVRFYWDGQAEWQSAEDWTIYSMVYELRTTLGGTGGGSSGDLGARVDAIYRRVNDLYAKRNRE